MILPQLLTPVLSKGPGNTAIHFLGKETSYRDLLHTIGRLSYLLQKEMGAGHRVAYFGSNSAAFIPAFFALMNNRSLTIPIDPSYTDNEIGQWLHDTQPTYVLVTSDCVSRARDILRRQGMNPPIMEIEKKFGGEYDTSFVPPPDNPPIDKDPILLLRTAKTAGTYKYCLFNHLQLQAPLLGIKKLYRFSGKERVLTPHSWAHPFAFTHGMLWPILSGAACIVDLGEENEKFLDFVDQTKPTRLIAMPDFVQKLMIVCQQTKRRLSGVKTVTVSAASINPESSTMLATMKTGLLECYGVTENLWTIAMSDAEAAAAAKKTPPLGLIGNKYKVVDANGDEVAGAVREGSLCVTGGSVMLRYEGRDEAAAKKLTTEAIRGTWLYTGDICRLEDRDKDVFVTFIRRKDGLKSTPKPADTYLPALIEAALRAQEGVADAAVFRSGVGNNGAIFGAVVKKQGCESTEFQVLEGAKASLTPKNIPSALLFMDSIPRQADGAPDGKALEKILEARPKK